MTLFVLVMRLCEVSSDWCKLGDVHTLAQRMIDCIRVFASCQQISSRSPINFCLLIAGDDILRVCYHSVCNNNVNGKLVTYKFSRLNRVYECRYSSVASLAHH